MADEADSTLRVCKHCKIEKPLPAFVRRKGGSGFAHKCRQCRSDERRADYQRREGEYSKWDTDEAKSKRAANSKNFRGRYVWSEDWLKIRTVKTCGRCKIELPANPAWFTPCTTNRTGLASWCKSCAMRHYDENKPKRNAEQRARWRRLMDTDPDGMRREKRERRRRDPERANAYMRFWREANRERSLALGVAKENRRRARKAHAPGSFSREDIEAMHETQKGRCWYCSKKLKKYHVEHRIPLCRGGTNDPSNLVLACPPCNLSKGARMPWEMEEPRLL